ncbi:hypothetical protein [Burkholderia ubonensis]|uniref:Phage tail protein n=1 Tax=Burkholderia ubonensis TaxID=101571 RepID=A0ABD4E0L6_9BURK|nr:hypothetical protein [Burkholderia ubonensis]KVN83492.1 hypothetical protein WJ68_16405 [Burkholderia ubonensis]
MSFYPHTRSLGSQPGVQLNPKRDNTDGFVTDQSDQVISVLGRFKRGRIDQPFLVDRGNIKRKLGKPESLRVSALNEAYVQTYEAVNNGARSAVVCRLTTSLAVNKYLVYAIDTTTGASNWSISAAMPTGSYVFALLDRECYNDGSIYQVSAAKVTDATSGQAVPNDVVTLTILDPDGVTVRFTQTGSLNPSAVDEFGRDYFIGSLLAQQTDLIELAVAAGAQIPVAGDCYGRDANGNSKVASSGVQVLFTEGGTAYASADYDRVLASLENSTFDYGYMITAGSQSVAQISKQAALSVRANRHLAVDVPGSLSVDAAITFIKQFNFDQEYVTVYWAPLQTDDPLNGGKAVIGTGGLQVGLRCARNAQTNSYGLAPKNFPIAGSDWVLPRTGVKQLVTPDDITQKSDLADAGINPVLFEKYNGGGKYVFTDSLTTKKTKGYLKLASVAEMSGSFDDMVSKYGKEALQKPMEIAIDKMEKFLESLFFGARSSGWLVASDDSALGDKGYAFTVRRNAQRPADRMDVTYGLHYDGVARAIYVTQTVSA